jgi:ribosome-associated translation inhibitor RaiA
MVQTAPVVIHFRDLHGTHHLRQQIEKRCAHLHDEFHEVSRFEITVQEDGKTGFVATGHVTGKGTDVGTHVAAREMEPAADQLLDKIERHLRRVHDKRIYGQRRGARRDPAKRVMLD